MSANCPQRARIDGHFCGALSPSDEHALREHLPRCAECRGHYERHLLLASLDPKARPAQERLGLGLGLWRRPVARLAWATPLALAAAAAMLLLIRPASTGDFAARGGAQAQPRVLVYRIAQGSPSQVHDQIHASDELAFAYENPGPARSLLIFGTDEHRHVYWYHPSWTDPAANPGAILAEKTEGLREISAAVRHPLDGARLVLRALFVQRPMKVREVESRVAALPDEAAPLDIEDAVEERFDLRVVP